VQVVGQGLVTARRHGHLARDGRAVVIDASVFVDLTLRPGVAARDHLRDAQLHAPCHLDLKVLSAIARLHRAGEVDEPAARAALAQLSAAPITRHALVELVDEAWARRENVRVADGLYVALAERLDAPLVTADAKLARACPGAIDVSS
jgi:predicted nucleic acid-binding protein